MNRVMTFQKELKSYYLAEMKAKESELFERLNEKQEIDKLFDSVKSQPNALVKDFEALDEFFK
jgi:hypothetical protein